MVRPAAGRPVRRRDVVFIAVIEGRAMVCWNWCADVLRLIDNSSGIKIDRRRSLAAFVFFTDVEGGDCSNCGNEETQAPPP